MGKLKAPSTVLFSMGVGREVDRNVKSVNRAMYVISFLSLVACHLIHLKVIECICPSCCPCSPILTIYWREKTCWCVALVVAAVRKSNRVSFIRSDWRKSPRAAVLTALRTVCFSWLTPLMYHGHKQSLEECDMFSVLPEDQSEILGEELQRYQDASHYSQRCSVCRNVPTELSCDINFS